MSQTEIIPHLWPAVNIVNKQQRMNHMLDKHPTEDKTDKQYYRAHSICIPLDMITVYL